MGKILPDLKISEDLLSTVVEQTLQESHLESYGVLAGKNGEIAGTYSIHTSQLTVWRSEGRYKPALEENRDASVGPLSRRRG